MLTYQACENVLWSRIKKGTVIVFMVTVGVLALCYIIIPGLQLIAAGAEKPEGIEPAVLTGPERAEHYRLLRKHGLIGDVSAIEIGKNGQLFFYRDGKRCRFM